MDLDKILLEFSVEELSKLVLDLLAKLTKKDKTEFISKYINAKAALEEICEEDSNKFLNEVMEFCNCCLNGKYYFDPDEDIDYYYDKYGYNYDYEGDYSEVFEDSEWASKFSEYLRIAGMYLRNNDYEIAYKTFDVIINCLHQGEYEINIFGTDIPREYIKINWEEVFDEYYLALKSRIG